MKNRVIILICLFLTGCIDPLYPLKDEYKVGSCYKWGDEAVKIVSKIEDEFYYKHNWNDQDKIFSDQNMRGTEIPCGKDGYEFEVLVYKINRAETSIQYLDDLTKPLRKNRK